MKRILDDWIVGFSLFFGALIVLIIFLFSYFIVKQ
jgi:hypothetical protein